MFSTLTSSTASSIPTNVISLLVDNVLFAVEANQFADQTFDEFKSTYLFQDPQVSSEYITFIRLCHIIIICLLAK